MRWGVEYEQNDGGMIGLILFSADDMQAAHDYVDDMCKKYGFTKVSNLKQIVDLVSGFMHLANAGTQPLIGHLASARRSLSPGVIATD